MTVVTEKSMSYKRGRSQQSGTWRGRAWGGDNDKESHEEKLWGGSRKNRREMSSSFN